MEWTAAKGIGLLTVGSVAEGEVRLNLRERERERSCLSLMLRAAYNYTAHCFKYGYAQRDFFFTRLALKAFKYKVLCSNLGRDLEQQEI